MLAIITSAIAATVLTHVGPVVTNTGAQVLSVRAYELQVPIGHNPNDIIVDKPLKNGWLPGALVLARTPRLITSACLWDYTGKLYELRTLVDSPSGVPEIITWVSIETGVVVVWGRGVNSLGLGRGSQWAIVLPQLLDTAIVDVTTNGTNPGDPLYGVPDGTVNGADLSFFTQVWYALSNGS